MVASPRQPLWMDRGDVAGFGAHVRNSLTAVQRLSSCSSRKRSVAVDTARSDENSCEGE